MTAIKANDHNWMATDEVVLEQVYETFVLPTPNDAARTRNNISRVRMKNTNYGVLKAFICSCV